MNGDLIAVVDYLEREKGIERETLIVAIEQSLLSAARKSVTQAKEVTIEVDRKTLKIRAMADFTVVEKVENSLAEITIKKARDIKPDAQPGEVIRIEVTPKNFGRIAAQTAKQVIIQKIREAERDIIFNEYKDRVGDIVNGMVRRYEHGNVIVDLGRCEAVMPYNEKCPLEEYPIGSRVRAYVVSVKSVTKGPEIILSRSHPHFVKRLFELEVPEIYDGTVEIKGIAREPGYRTKIAVYSTDEKVDPVGACVGMRGARVKNIVGELNGEKIDIVPWSERTAKYVENALSPAKIKHIVVNDQEKTVTVIVDPDQLSLSIGKKGQNIRLTAKLVNMRIDIKKTDEIEGGIALPASAEQVGEAAPTAKQTKLAGAIEQAVEKLHKIPGVGRKVALSLVEAGFTSIEGLVEADPKDLSDIPGIGEKTAEKIIENAKQYKPEE
ncbi:MAG TPA: transcription termination factor NusA [bacterium]|nr:transcription termination factor NusA [bacterium]